MVRQLRVRGDAETDFRGRKARTSNSRVCCFPGSSQTLYEALKCSRSILSLTLQEKLNEAVMVMNRNLQEVNVQNMNVELVAQMFKNYQSNVLFHLEGEP